MKLRTIANVFNASEQETPLIIKVMDSIKDFKRKLELILSFKEAKEIYETFKDTEQTMIKTIIEKHCEEENAKPGMKLNYDLKPDDFKSVPEDKMPDYLEDINKLLDTEIKIKKPFKFTHKEIEESKIVVSEIIRMETFIVDPNPKPPPPPPDEK